MKVFFLNDCVLDFIFVVVCNKNDENLVFLCIKGIKYENKVFVIVRGSIGFLVEKSFSFLLLFGVSVIL